MDICDIYEETEEFYNRSATEKRVVGKSLFGRKLFAVKLGEGFPVGIVQYATHGREWITARLAAAHYAAGLKKGAGSVWIVPLVNPDGALLSQRGLLSAPRSARDKLLLLNGGSEDFSLWKANGRGVDINVNFAADWGGGKRNVRVAGAENYIGARPFSESETRALRDFTREISPDYTLSYHTKGEEIYWYYHQPLYVCARDKSLAIALSKATGYPLAFAAGSAGGYKDWCIKTLKIPAFTVEAGGDRFSHPIGEGEEAEQGYLDIESHNLSLLNVLAQTAARTLKPKAKLSNEGYKKE